MSTDQLPIMPARIAFCLMVHDNPSKIRDFSKLLKSFGHDVFIHLDATVQNADREFYISTVCQGGEDIKFVSAVKCEWGSWNLVEGVLNLLTEVVKVGVTYTHVQLLSGADLPTQNLEHFRHFLTRNPNVDFIETVDISVSKWAIHGPERERFIYYFPYNWRLQRGRFNLAFNLQRWFRVNRRIPCGINPRLGSQWWTLRLSTCQKILNFLEKHPEVEQYFKYTLIPDECFFQSLVPRLINPLEIVPRSLTLYKFTPYGKPFVFYDDHFDWLTEEPFFFIRKVSPTSKVLEQRLFERATTGPRPAWSDTSAGVHSWELLLESARAFQFEDPMVGHIGSSGHQALKNPTCNCMILVCDNTADQFDIVSLLRTDPSINCIDPYHLPPYRGWGADSLPPVGAFLANELNLPTVTTCIVTTTKVYSWLLEDLSGLTAVKIYAAVVDSAEKNRDRNNSIVTRQSALAGPSDTSAIASQTVLPIFRHDQHSDIIKWVHTGIPSTVIVQNTPPNFNH